MKRWEIIQALIDANGYTRYLEVGVQHGHCLSRVNCAEKYGVDPFSDHEGVTHPVSSADFWKANRKKYDLIFIDGDHSHQMAHLDILAALKACRAGGAIVVHDCLPPEKQYQGPRRPRPSGRWYGEVWRAWLDVMSGGIHGVVVDTDEGVGVIRMDTMVGEPFDLPDPMTWDWMWANRHDVMNVIPVDVAASLLWEDMPQEEVEEPAPVEEPEQEEEDSHDEGPGYV